MPCKKINDECQLQNKKLLLKDAKEVTGPQISFKTDYASESSLPKTSLSFFKKNSETEDHNMHDSPKPFRQMYSSFYKMPFKITKRKHADSQNTKVCRKRKDPKKKASLIKNNKMLDVKEENYWSDCNDFGLEKTKDGNNIFEGHGLTEVIYSQPEDKDVYFPTFEEEQMFYNHSTSSQVSAGILPSEWLSSDDSYLTKSSSQCSSSDSMKSYPSNFLKQPLVQPSKSVALTDCYESFLDLEEVFSSEDLYGNLEVGSNEIVSSPFETTHGSSLCAEMKTCSSSDLSLNYEYKMDHSHSSPCDMYSKHHVMPWANSQYNPQLQHSINSTDFVIDRKCMLSAEQHMEPYDSIVYEPVVKNEQEISSDTAYDIAYSMSRIDW